MVTAANGAIVSRPAMISFAAAGLNRGSAPHARAAADETGTADGFGSGPGVTTAGAASASAKFASAAFASVASAGGPVWGAVRAGAGDGARAAAPGAPPPGIAATAHAAVITAASASRLPGIGRLSPVPDGRPFPVSGRRGYTAFGREEDSA